MTPAGIEPTTFRFVAQHLNCATAVPLEERSCTKNDQYRRLQLQFCVLLMMGVVDTRNT